MTKPCDFDDIGEKIRKGNYLVASVCLLIPNYHNGCEKGKRYAVEIIDHFKKELNDPLLDLETSLHYISVCNALKNKYSIDDQDYDKIKKNVYKRLIDSYTKVAKNAYEKKDYLTVLEKAKVIEDCCKDGSMEYPKNLEKLILKTIIAINGHL
ncbi:MAG: hypothetical protein QXD62_01030 [Candidatus Woesearchaeota archaeon]